MTDPVHGRLLSRKPRKIEHGTGEVPQDALESIYAKRGQVVEGLGQTGHIQSSGRAAFLYREYDED